MKRLLSLLLLAVLALTAVPVRAESDQSFASFSARAVLPENQYDSRNTFFDLMLEPGAEQTIELRISNASSEPMTAEVALNAASTGQDGLINYSRPGVRDESMALSVEDVATLRQSSVPVPANGEAGVLIDLAMPDTEFDGMLLGGLVVTKAQEETDTDTDEAVMLKNELTYVIGLQIRQSTAEVAPELHLVGIEPGTVNHHTAVSVRLRNSEPVVMKGVVINAEVYGDGVEAMRTLYLPNAEMAPNSTSDFVIDWNNEALKSGIYRLEMTAQQDERVWRWSETFEIGSGIADAANGQAVGLTTSSSRLVTSILLLLLLVVILLTGWRIYRERRRTRGAV